MAVPDTVSKTTLGFLIDETHYGLALRPKNKEHYTEKIINGYIVQMIRNYTADHYKDEDLWATFHDDFEEFSQEIFA
jgi:hypothetical protein